MNRWWIGIALLLCSAVALAAAPATVRRQVEASMLVNGSIEVDGQGRVVKHELDGRGKLPASVEQFLDAQIAGWRFEPAVVDGRPVASRNRMGLLLVATPAEGGDFQVELRHTSFYPVQPDGHEVSAIDMTPPSYPATAVRAGVAGTVYLVLRIDAGGRVTDVFAEQVNLRITASAAEMQRWRDILARSAGSRALQWSFVPPHQGDLADDGSWTVRVPVDYSLGQGNNGYGRWQAYVPGPRQQAPWARGDDGVSPEALAGGGLYPVGLGGAPRLLTPLSPAEG